MQQSNDPSAMQKVQPLVTLSPASGSQVTKIIFSNNTTLGNHSVSSNIGSVGPQSIVLASPTKTITLSKNVGAPQVLKPMPGTPTKSTVYVLPPMKTAQKIGSMSSTLKSPIRIAPATSVPFTTVLASKVAVSPGGMVNSTLPKTLTIQQSPKKVLVKPLFSNTNASATTSSNFSSLLNPIPMSSVVQVSSSSVTSHQVQLPSNKLHYVRLVTANSASVTTCAAPKQVTATVSNVSTIVSSAATSVTSSNTPIRFSLPLGSVIAGQKQAIPVKMAPKSLISGTSIAQIRPGNQVTAGQLSQIAPGTLIPLGGSGAQSYVVLPSNYITQMQSSSVQNPNQVVLQNVNIVPSSASANSSELESRTLLPAASASSCSSESSASRTSFIPIAPSGSNAQCSPAQPSSPLPSSRFVNGRISMGSCDSRPRKPCNCTKSQCLKLYCECFANGEFCNSCNCNNCYNNLDHEIERQKAIKACLDRNPMAFHPKIGKSQGTDKERRHTKGCNCRRSGCLKNYCECYEAKILCTNLCRCIGCKNFEDSSEKKTLLHLADAAEVRVQQAAATANLSSNMLRLPVKHLDGARRNQLPSSYITDDVIQRTIECLMAQANAAESQYMPRVETERLLLEEFGHCLRTIITCSNQAADSDSDSELNV